VGITGTKGYEGTMARTRILILGAAGRDFHLFNTCYRDNADVEVVAFTATQIPFIDDRRYPAAIAGKLYPNGIPIHPEEELVDLVLKNEKVDEAVFAYSDVSPTSYLAGEKRQLVEAAGVGVLHLRRRRARCCRVEEAGHRRLRRPHGLRQEPGLPPRRRRAPRHGPPWSPSGTRCPTATSPSSACSASPPSRTSIKHKCTIEEREEYEPHIAEGNVVYAGVDYEARSSSEAERRSRRGHLGRRQQRHCRSTSPTSGSPSSTRSAPATSSSYFPGDVNFKRRRRDPVINKMDEAKCRDVALIERHIQEHNPEAKRIKADSLLNLTGDVELAGKNVLVVEDGPTLTHGGMKIGAGVVAAQRAGVKSLVDPRPFLKGSLVDTFAKYPDIGDLLPAMGYGDEQMKDLEATIAATECDAVVIGTPIDLGSLIKIDKPTVRVSYELEEPGEQVLERLVFELVEKSRSMMAH
jgi:predicted GTPase